MKSKMVVLAMAVVLLAAGTAFADMGKFTAAVKAGVDFGGNYEADGLVSDYDTDTSASIGAEAYYKVLPYVDAGAGVQYMFQREIDTSPGWKFWFLPVYGAVRVHPEMTDYTPYGIAQVGYAFHGGNSAYWNDINTNGGLYWGVGAGFIFKRHFLAEILYSEANGTVEPAPGIDFDVKHRRWTFSVGYNF